MAGRRELLLDAAIRVLGRAGSRGLTHRAVDEEAGLALGSTSNHFRTRGALVTGVVERLEALDYEGWRTQTADVTVASAAELGEVLTRLVIAAVTAERARTQARYALFVEAAIAGPASAIAASIERGRGNLLAWGSEILGPLGADDPVRAAHLLVDVLDGLILHQLTRDPVDTEDIRARIDELIAAILPVRPAR